MNKKLESGDLMESTLRRYLAKNVDILVLGMVMDSDVASGYEIALQLWKKYGILKHMSSIYPILHRMQRDGLLSARYHKEGPHSLKKAYNITEKGKEFVENYIENLLKSGALRTSIANRLR